MANSSRNWKIDFLAFRVFFYFLLSLPLTSWLRAWPYIGSSSNSSRIFSYPRRGLNKGISTYARESWDTRALGLRSPRKMFLRTTFVYIYMIIETKPNTSFICLQIISKERPLIIFIYHSFSQSQPFISSSTDKLEN